MEALGRLREAIDELKALGPESLSSMEDTLALATQLDRLEALTTEAFAFFDAGGEWRASRSYSAAHWLAWKHGMHVGVARRRQRLGRALRSMPATEAAWIDGEITGQHVAKLAAAQARAPELFERDEKLLLDNARELRYGHFARSVDYWILQADRDGCEERAGDVEESRRFNLSRSFEDTWFCDGLFDPVSGTIISEELKRLERELFLEDWAEAKARLGRDPHIGELARTAPQRRSDAVREMAVRSSMADANGRRPEPLFTVLVGYETFHGMICELANRMVVTPGALIDWLDHAWIERIVFDGPSRVIDVGVHRRLFEGATRRAIEVRDQECFHPSCDIPAEDCQADHVEPWGWGGETVQDNGRAACGFHNRARHRRSEPPTP